MVQKLFHRLIALHEQSAPQPIAIDVFNDCLLDVGPRLGLSQTTFRKRDNFTCTQFKTLPFSREEHGSVRLCRPLRRAHLRADTITITHAHAAGMCAARWRATSPQRRRSLHRGQGQRRASGSVSSGQAAADAQRHGSEEKGGSWRYGSEHVIGMAQSHTHDRSEPYLSSFKSRYCFASVLWRGPVSI